MAGRLDSYLSILTIGLFLFGFLIFSYSVIGLLLLVFTVLFFMLTLILISSKHASKDPAEFSKLKFIIPVPPIIALVLSSGYIFTPLPYFRSIKYQDVGVFAYLFILLEMFILFTMITETKNKISTPFEKAGYDISEINNELGKFSKNISMLALISFVLSSAISFMLIYGPEINIGILPAIIIFLFIYVYVIFNYVKRSSSSD